MKLLSVKGKKKQEMHMDFVLIRFYGIIKKFLENSITQVMDIKAGPFLENSVTVAMDIKAGSVLEEE